MALSEQELENQLLEAGNKLSCPPSSIDELLALLDRVEIFLTRVEQSPSESMSKALSPTIKAIIADDLLKHSDVDVRVAVATCINEITRITAPDAPYEDDQMKDVFQLFVSSFEKIDDKSSRSYCRRIIILETVAKVRSCVVMLDLECDGLILEMFQHFFRTIRDDLAENVFSSMETIMTLVLEESEDVSLDLVSSILDILKTENKEALPIARQLAETVVEKCASKLKPYLLPAVKSRGDSLNDYSKVVANVCQVAPEAVEPSDGDAASKNSADESDFGSAPKENADEVAMETLDDAPPSEEIDATIAEPPKLVVSNGTIQNEVEDTSEGIDDTKVEVHDNCDGVQTDPELSKAGVGSLNAGKKAKSKSKPKKSKKRKSRTSALKTSYKPSGSTVNDDKKETDTLPELQEGSKDVDCAHSEDAIADHSGPPQINEEPEAPAFLEKTTKTENDNADVTFPLPTGDVTLPLTTGCPADKSISEEDGEGNKIDKVVQESVPTSDIELKKESDSQKASVGTNVSKPRLHKSPGKMKGEVVQESAPASENDSHMESASNKLSEGANVSELKPHKSAGKMKYEVVQESAAAIENDSHKESESKKASEATNVSESKPHKRKMKDEPLQKSAPASENDSHKESKSKKASEETNVSESKPHKRTGKKSFSEPDKEKCIESPGNASTKKDKDTGNIAVNSAKQPGKKDEVASSQSEDKKKRGQGKGTSFKVHPRTSSVDEQKTPLPNSTEPSSKEESGVKKTSKTSSKRKQSSSKEKSPGRIKDQGEELVGSKIKVWWPEDKKFYFGVVQSFDSAERTHKVVYDDGDVELLKLEEEKWKLIEGDTVANQECTSEGEGPDDVSETPKGKKLKTGEGVRTKLGKVETTAKKGASSSKSKTKLKSGGKQKDESITVDDDPEEESLMSLAKSNQGKGKSKAASSKSAAKPDQEKDDKSKNENSDPHKGTNKSKAKKTEKTKPDPSSPKVKEAEERDKSPEADKAVETAAKGKTPKTQKKRKRGVKGW